MAKDEMMRPEDPYKKERDYEKGNRGRPVVGQSKPYSGGNAHGKHETPRKNPAGAGEIPLGGPFRKE